MEKIKGICIKSYEDEDDLTAYEDGEIDEDEIRVHKVGDESLIVDEYYNKEYWKPIK
jgi:hypothetical protein